MASSLGLALRDSTAATLLRALTMVDPAVVDRLGLFDGRAPMQELGTEICACLAAGFCRTLAADGWDADDAMRICERVSAEALGKTAPAPEQIRRYANSKAPVRDVAWLAADILGTPNDAAAIHSVMSPYCEALRVQFVAVSREMKRLTGT